LFDADFLPDADFLKRTIPQFRNQKIGCVQCRWGHLNFNHSLITRLQGVGHDGHFIVEQFSKCKTNHLFNFNGTGGVWRRSAILDAGDWSSDTLAEDLDLSYRAQLKGWKIQFLRDVVVPAELPVSITAFKQQQSRWARGSMQTALKLIGPVWTSNRISLSQKVESSIHLFAYGAHPLMFLNLVLTVVLFFLMPHRTITFIEYVILSFAVGPLTVVAYSQLYLGKDYKFILSCMIGLVLLHHGLVLNNTWAALFAFSKQKGIFERTPKFGDTGTKWIGTSYAKKLGIPLPWAELVAIVLLGLTMYTGLFFQVHYPTYNWLFFFSSGFVFVVILQLQELWSKLNQKRKS